MSWYFMSFRDPETNTNLGCCNVEVDDGGMEEKMDAAAAVRKSRNEGCNPGGEVMIHRFDEPESQLEPNKLYSKAELFELGYEYGGKTIHELGGCACCKEEEDKPKVKVEDIKKRW